MVTISMSLKLMEQLDFLCVTENSKFQPLYTVRSERLINNIPQSSSSLKPANRVKEIPTSLGKPPTNHQLVTEPKSIVLLSSEDEPTSAPSIPTPSCNEKTDSHPPNNTETVPEISSHSESSSMARRLYGHI